MTTRVDTLGGLHVHRDGEELSALLGRRIQCALLVFLAVERQASREAVMSILWPERDREKARGSLNNTAYELRRVLGDDWVTLHGDVLRVADGIVTDVGMMERAVAQERFADAVELVGGGFLDGTRLAQTPEFDHWIDRHHATYEQLAKTAQRGHVQQLYGEGDVRAALRASRAWASRAPLDDEAQYWLVRLLAESGHRADALTHYERFSERLAAEFDVRPDEAVQELVAQIRAGEVSALESPPGPRARVPREGLVDAEDARRGRTPRDSWRPSPGWGTKLLKVVGAYIAISAGILQGIDLLIGYYPSLPNTFFRAALVLLLCGLPIVAATVFFQSRPVGEGEMRGVRFLAARWFSWRNALLGAVAASAAWTAAAVGWNVAGRLSLDDDSVVVLPFHTSTSDETERLLADELADEVARELSSWDSIRAVPPVSLGGPMFDLGLTTPTLERTADGVAIARALRASRLAALIVDVRNDSAYVSTTLFDAASARALRQPIEASGPAAGILALAATVAHGILGLDTLAIDPDRVRRGTSNREALLADVTGLRHLERWRLREAERSFRRAVAADPRFSLAHLHLAQSLYWQAARDDNRLQVVGPEIERTSTLAVGEARDLGVGDRMHVSAFHAFQSGAYEQARSLYRELLSKDTTDVYAWLMLGSVEYRDPWLVAREDGALLPRSDLNVAVRAFTEAVRLQPTFDLGYGHLFDIHDAVEAAADRYECSGYLLPSGRRRPVWDPTPGIPGELRSFCPVLTDSILWITSDSLRSTDRAVIQAGADRLLDDGLDKLIRWSAYAPSEPTPREQLSTVWLRKRQRLGIAPPEQIEALADSALHHASAALAQRSDTLHTDLANLAALHLATGASDEAFTLAREALTRYESQVPRSSFPARVLNVFVASGQPSLAIDALSRHMDRETYVPDPMNDSFIPYGGAESVVDRVTVLGSAGVGGRILRESLEELDRIWTGSSYSEREREVLRESVALRIATALSLDESSLDRWTTTVDVPHPLWSALRGTPTDSAMAFLTESVQESPPSLSPVNQHFLEAVAAERLGDIELALARLNRIDSIPMRADLYDFSWGLRTLSYLRRARLYDSEGDTMRARSFFARFLATRQGDDPLTAPLYRDAQLRLGGVPRPR